MRRRAGGMNPGPETSMEQHCLHGETRLHLFLLSPGGKDSTALLWDAPAATFIRTGTPNRGVPTSNQPWPLSHTA